jgi:hypothetical protein
VYINKIERANIIIIIINKIKKTMEHVYTDLIDISKEIGSLLPQLGSFIEQFNKIIIEYNVNVMSDSNGNFCADVLNTMSEEQSDKIVKRIGIIDSLISSHKMTISDLFARGFAIERDLKADKYEFTSPLVDKLAEYKKLAKAYQH